MAYLSTPVKLLTVEPDAHTPAALARRLLRSAPQNGVPALFEAATLSDAVELLRSQQFDVILLGLTLPDAHGLDAVEHMLTEVQDTPVIVVANDEHEALARQALSAGAQDYLLASEVEPRSMHRAIRNAMERHRLLRQERLSRSAAERARTLRDEVIAVVSHDLRAPLNAIALCAGGLADPRTDHAELGRTILEAAEWTRRVIRDLLDVAAIDRGTFHVYPHPCDLCDIVGRARALFMPVASSREITLVVECPVQGIQITVDGDRIQQALDNLIDNALRATPPGGAVRIGAHLVDVAHVALSVADSGAGIDAGRLAALLHDPALRAGAAATPGLGLTIVKNIAHLHGGRLVATSEPGQGSRFTVILPVAAGAS